MDCPLWNWDWNVCLDIPNWHALLIELIIGTGIATVFFIWQWRIRTKRREFFQENFISTAYWIKSLLHQGAGIQSRYYENKEKHQMEVNQLHQNFSSIANNLRFSLGISADSMDQKIVMIIDIICTIMEKPLIEGDPEEDSDNFITIDSIIDELFNGSFKEAHTIYQSKKMEQELKNKELLKKIKDSKV
jgi:hypothetical protein